MWLEYDPTGDIAYVYVGGDAREKFVDRTEDVSRGDEYSRGIDRGAAGEIIGYEFMNASRGIDLEGLPHHDELAILFARVGSLRALDLADCVGLLRPGEDRREAFGDDRIALDAQVAGSGHLAKLAATVQQQRQRRRRAADRDVSRPATRLGIETIRVDGDQPARRWVASHGQQVPLAGALLRAQASGVGAGRVALQQRRQEQCSDLLGEDRRPSERLLEVPAVEGDFGEPMGGEPASRAIAATVVPDRVQAGLVKVGVERLEGGDNLVQRSGDVHRLGRGQVLLSALALLAGLGADR